MPTYIAPVQDMMFLFEKLRNNKNYNEIEKYKEVTPELVRDILEEAAKINQNIILPLAKVGDENPTVLENGVVRTPPGYKEAYNKFIEDGWTSLSCDPKYGGQGMPKTVSAFFDEMLSSASLSFKLYSELSIGAYNCINRHATDSIKEKYLPKIASGEYLSCYALTESNAGSDALSGTTNMHEVAQQPLILYDPGNPGSSYSTFINESFRNAGITPKVEMNLDSVEAVKNMVELGLGISFLPRSALRKNLENGTLVIVPLAQQQQVLLPTYVLVRKGQHYSPTVLAFLGLLHQIYNADISVLPV